MNPLVLALQRVQQALSQAEFPEALQLAQRVAADPKLDPRAFMDLGMLFFQAQQYTPAVDYLRRAERHPATKWVAAYYRALALDQLGRLVEARTLLRLVAQAQPVEAALVELVKLELKCGDTKAAATTLESVRQKFPALVAGPVLSARVALADGDEAQAAEWWDKAVAMVAKDPAALSEILCERGYVLQNLGQFDPAGEAFLQAAEASPIAGRPYSLLFHSRKVTESDAFTVVAAEDRLAKSKDTEQTYYLEFALAKAKHDAKDYQQAAKHYEAANRLGRTVRQTEGMRVGGAVKVMHNRLENVLTKDEIQRLAAKGNPTEKPIFIVGMIRTGTTLMEQILSSHPDVRGAGELEFWIKNAPSFFDFTRGKVVEPVLREGAREYLEVLDLLGDGSSRVTDKNPSNITFAGLLHAAYPNARFVCMRRKPIDIAMSVWMTPISSDMPFLGDKQDIVDVIRETNRIADYWSTVLPQDRFMQVSYEDLVHDKEGHTRRILEFLDLPWNDQVMSHEKNKREVLTPSMWQVRQKVYTTSVDRWRPYEPWLGEFSQLIGQEP